MSSLLYFLPVQLKAAIQVLGAGSAAFLQIYTVLLTFRLYCSWFPNINMYYQPFSTVGTMTNFYLRFWRSFMPPQMLIDTSPIFAFWILDLMVDVSVKLSYGQWLY
jgi:YggT family protein|tara:strand:+ start:76 stop:393 length:318 start_codon:yes stop_codon:yes gene_type:complete